MTLRQRCAIQWAAQTAHVCVLYARVNDVRHECGSEGICTSDHTAWIQESFDPPKGGNPATFWLYLREQHGQDAHGQD